MSPSVNITTRVRCRTCHHWHTKATPCPKCGDPRTDDTRYHVRYRTGGRTTPERRAGSFTLLRHAQARRDFITGEIAAGRDPQQALAQLATPTTRHTLAARWEQFINSRRDASPKTIRGYQYARDIILPILGPDTPPEQLTVGDIAEVVVRMTEREPRPYAPSTMKQYLNYLAQVLDFADIEPNPARSRKIRLPRGEHVEVEPPTTAEWAAILDHVPPRRRLVLRLIECTGLRVEEAVTLSYGDVDFADGRIRIARANTKTQAGRRWLPVPPVLLDELAGLVPLEDRRRDRRVFPATTPQAVRMAMARACVRAGVAHYHPHDLRHRRISLWFAMGVDPVRVRAWAGHARASVSSDTYGHVLMAGEDEWRPFWLAVYRGGSVRERETRDA